MAVNRIWFPAAPALDISPSDRVLLGVGYGGITISFWTLAGVSSVSYSLVAKPTDSWSLVAKSATNYSLVAKPSGSSQDGAYTEPTTDGAYAESGPSKFGIPDGAWTDTGDGWTPAFPPIATSYSLVAKPT